MAYGKYETRERTQNPKITSSLLIFFFILYLTNTWTFKQYQQYDVEQKSLLSLYHIATPSRALGPHQCVQHTHWGAP